MDVMDRLIAFDRAASGEPLLARLLVASLELAALATVTALLFAWLRPRSARVRSIAWLIVLAKPVVSLAIGSPIALVGLTVPRATGGATDATLAGHDVRLGGASERPAREPAVAVHSQANREAVAAPRSSANGTRGSGPAELSSPAPLADLSADSAPAPAATRRHSPWPQRFVLLWLVGAALQLVRSLVDRWRAQRLVKRARPAEPALVEQVARLARECGLARVPTIRRSAELSSPAAVGVVAPTLLLPTWMEDRRDLHWSACHELTHLRLLDPLAALVREAAQLLFWFHPVAWWSGRQWEEAAELACDRAMVATEQESLEYADRLCAIALVVKARGRDAACRGVFVARSRVGARLETLLRTPLASRARLGRAGATIATLAAVAVLTCGAALQSAQPPASTTALPEELPQPAANAADDDVVAVAGRVLDPAGKPVPDARVEILRWYWDRRVSRPALATTRTDLQGHFATTYRKSQFTVDVARAEQWREVQAVCCVDGFGIAWDERMTAQGVPESREFSLQLTRDAPVRGRMVDLEGRPVAGATLRVTAVRADRNEDLGPYLAALRRGSALPHSQRLASRHLPPLPDDRFTAVTDAQGRFELHGLGAHRVVNFETQGETIASEQLMLVTEPLAEPLQEPSPVGGGATLVHGMTLELVAPPTQPIEGVVRAADTGLPLADVEVASWVFAGTRLGGADRLRTTTDEAGRFRLVGMPKGPGNQLHLRPSDEEPYFQREVEVPPRTGFEAIEMEIELDRGIWITGHVKDAASGLPGEGTVHWLPLISNTFVQKRPRLAPGGLSLQGDQRRYQVQRDGSYRVLGLPGPAAIGVSSSGPYRQGVGFEAFADVVEKNDFGITYMNPISIGTYWPTSMARIDPPADAANVRVDLLLDRGASVRVQCRDEQGASITDFEVKGVDPRAATWRVVEGGAFVIDHLAPEEQRKVQIRHGGRRLGLVARIGIGDGAEQSVTLVPCATITGRVLDESNDPVALADLTLTADPTEPFETLVERVATDADGRFRYDLLLHGSSYALTRNSNPDGMPRLVARFSEPKPGAVVELGDCKPPQGE